MTIILVWQTRQLLSMVLASSGRLVTQNRIDQLFRGVQWQKASKSESVG